MSAHGNARGADRHHRGKQREHSALLHDAGQYIIGRMGLPYRAKGVNIISVVLDAPQDVISALAGRIGRLPGVSAKTAYSKPFPPAGD